MDTRYTKSTPTETFPRFPSIIKSAYHLNGIFGNSGKNSNRTVHPSELFSEKKVVPPAAFPIIISLFPELPEISVPFVHTYQCQAPTGSSSEKEC